MKFTKFFAFALTALAIVGCEPTLDTNDPDNKPSDGSTATGAELTANNVSVEVNTPITFTVTANDGSDITDKSTIYDKTHDFVEVDNPFTPTEDGIYEFYAVSGNIITSSITVSVVPTIPDVPADSDKANTSFNHRILMVDHTGTGCSWCPEMMKALKEIEESDYHAKYHEAMAHSYGAGDPAASSAAYAVSGYYNINNYPSLTYNFLHSTTSGHQGGADAIKAQIDALWKADGADAGIAAATSLAKASMIVNVEVKAAVAHDYRVTSWLLEDGIEAKQMNANEDWMNIHNHAIRQASTMDPISGHDLGTIEAGKTATLTMSLEIPTASWVRDNLKVLIIVSAKNENGKYEVANVAVCPANGSISYDYKK